MKLIFAVLTVVSAFAVSTPAMADRVDLPGVSVRIGGDHGYHHGDWDRDGWNRGEGRWHHRRHFCYEHPWMCR